ncbi:MAG TPA: tetratricopeptide repeat protein [Gemmatimonadaceae bacterium]
MRAMYGGAVATLQRAMYGGAVATLQRAIRVKPDYVAAHWLLGMSWLRLGEKEKALRVYKDLLKLDKKQADDLHEEISKSK